MILHLDRQPHDAVAAIDSSGHILKYSELLSFSEEINSLLPERSLLFLLTENNVDRKSTRLNSSHIQKSRMPSSA